MEARSTFSRPAEFTEQRLLNAILDGTFPIHSALPPERELALSLGVTRPTLREALQRLAREGWLRIHQGKPTLVRDYLREGNLLILNTLARQPQTLTPDFISKLLEARVSLAPAYTRLAVQNAPKELAVYLSRLVTLPDKPEDFAQADQQLHHELTILSGNPVFTLFLNSFVELSLTAGVLYFASKPARDYSRKFYQKLAEATIKEDARGAETLTREVMQTSLAFWQAQAPKQEE